MVARYGNFILYDPLMASTPDPLAWPLLVIVIGGSPSPGGAQPPPRPLPRNSLKVPERRRAGTACRPAQEEEKP